MDDLMLFGVWWVWWSLGTLGLIGTGLMIWFAPTVLLGLLKWLFTFCFTTRIGAALLAASIAFFVADVNRSKRDEAEFAERTALFEQAQTERDAKIKADTRTEVQAELANQTTKDTTTDMQVKDYQNALPTVSPTDVCSDVVRVGNNADRLRVIAGSPVRRSIRPQGVPKARKKAAGT